MRPFVERTKPPHAEVLREAEPRSTHNRSQGHFFKSLQRNQRVGRFVFFLLVRDVMPPGERSIHWRKPWAPEDQVPPFRSR